MSKKSLCLYFQIHQPARLRLYRFFDIGKDSHYYDDFTNRTILRRVAQKCYLPMNSLLLDLIKKHKGAFKVAFSISGSALKVVITGGAGTENYKVEKVIVTNLNNGVSTTIDGTDAAQLANGTATINAVSGVTVTANGLTTYQVVLTVDGETVTSNKVMA